MSASTLLESPTDRAIVICALYNRLDWIEDNIFKNYQNKRRYYTRELVKSYAIEVEQIVRLMQRINDQTDPDRMKKYRSAAKKYKQIT